MIQYEYDIKEIRSKKNRKIMVFDVIIVLLTIFLSIYYGIETAKNNYPKEEIIANEERQEVQEESKTESRKVLTPEQIQKINTIYEGQEKIAYLTFDDGPSASVTPLILDVLKQEQVTATFFLLGNRVNRYPELVKRELDEGHCLGNHGYTHRYSAIYQSIESILQEYEQTENEIRTAIGVENYHTNLFRFPGGSIGGPYHELKQQAVDILEQKGIAHINWNALTNDSVGTPTKEQMLAKLKGTVNGKNVVVILMHDAGDKILTYELLPEIIQYLKQNGYRFDNFSKLLNS